MGTIKRRFDSIKIDSNENNRRAYREMLFTTKGIEEAISGVILFDETLRTAASDGTPFSQVLSKKGIMPGIKVDKGPVDIPGFPGETRHRRTRRPARAGQRISVSLAPSSPSGAP